MEKCRKTIPPDLPIRYTHIVYTQHVHIHNFFHIKLRPCMLKGRNTPPTPCPEDGEEEKKKTRVLIAFAYQYEICSLLNSFIFNHPKFPVRIPGRALDESSFEMSAFRFTRSRAEGRSKLNPFLLPRRPSGRVISRLHSAST